MNFKCELCSYASRDKFNYEKHLNTKKHKEKVNENTFCPKPHHKTTIQHQVI